MKLPFYSKTKLLLAFEYGVILSQVAKENNVEVTKELMERMEKIILNEFSTKSPTKLSTETIPNILACFETE